MCITLECMSTQITFRTSQDLKQRALKVVERDINVNSLTHFMEIAMVKLLREKEETEEVPAE